MLFNEGLRKHCLVNRNKNVKNGMMRRVFGIGLLELMLSLSIIAVLLIIATKYYAGASSSEKRSQLQASLISLKVACLTYKGASGTFPADMTIEKLQKAGVLSKSDLDDAGTNFVTPWGTTATTTFTTAKVTVEITVVKDSSEAQSLQMITNSLLTQGEDVTFDGTKFTLIIKP